MPCLTKTTISTSENASYGRVSGLVNLLDHRNDLYRTKVPRSKTPTGMPCYKEVLTAVMSWLTILFHCEPASEASSAEPASERAVRANERAVDFLVFLTIKEPPLEL